MDCPSHKRHEIKCPTNTMISQYLSLHYGCLSAELTTTMAKSRRHQKLVKYFLYPKAIHLMNISTAKMTAKIMLSQ